MTKKRLTTETVQLVDTQPRVVDLGEYEVRWRRLDTREYCGVVTRAQQTGGDAVAELAAKSILNDDGSPVFADGDAVRRSQDVELLASIINLTIDEYGLSAKARADDVGKSVTAPTSSSSE